MITEKNHKLLTSQFFLTDCTKKGLASMQSYENISLIFDVLLDKNHFQYNSCRKNHFSTWCTRCSPLMYHRPWLVFLIFNHTFPVFYIPARRSRGGYIGILMSVCHTFAYRIIIKVPLNQIFSNFHTLLCTIKYRLRLITVYFTFTVSELWPFFS
jgi:hypothetical protein